MGSQVDLLKYRIIANSVTCLGFYALGKRWIDSVDERYFGELNRFRGQKSMRLQDSIDYVDRLFLVKQLLKFRMLLCVFFFSQLYCIMKAVFFYSLNRNNPTGECLSLTGVVR